jgi:hypothetical protein
MPIRTDTTIFKDFYESLLHEEQLLLEEQNTIKENISKHKDKPPIEDADGRFHAPYKGYQWTDGNVTISYDAGEYLPIEHYNKKEGYYQLSKKIIVKTLEIPYPIAEEMVKEGFHQENSIIRITRHKINEKPHYIRNIVKVINCDIRTTQWHLEYFKKFIDHYIVFRLKQGDGVVHDF